MPSTSVLLGTGLVTTTTYPYSIVIGGVEVAPSKAELRSLRFQDNGDDEPGTFSCRVWDPTSALAVPELGVIAVQENSSDEQVFMGFVQRRWYETQAVGRFINVEGISVSTYLDELIIPREVRPAESDRARVLYLWGKYARWPLSADVQFVTETASTIAADNIENGTLRSALRQTLALAGSTNRMSIDPLGRLHWFAGTESNPAPFNVNQANPPGGGNIAVDELKVERDATIKNRAYVRGANLVGSGWVQNSASLGQYGPRETYLDAPSSDTAAKKNAIANLYFGRMAQPRTRGEFETQSPNDGWRSGQNLTITDPANGLSAFAARVVGVTTTFLKGTGTKRYRIEFGVRKARASDVGGVIGGVPLESQSLAGGQFSTVGLVERAAPDTYGDGLIEHSNGRLRFRANQNAETGAGQGFELIGADVGFGDGGLLLPESATGIGFHVGLVIRDYTRNMVTMGFNDAIRAMTQMGFVLYAHPPGGGPLQTPTTARNLPTSGGAIMIPIPVFSHMRVYSLSLYNTDSANLRTAEWTLYETRIMTSSDGDLVTAVGNPDDTLTGTFSFTPGAASVQSSTPPTAGSTGFMIPPGMYVLVIRNTSATQTFGLGESPAGTMGITTCKTQTLGSSLPSTLDLATGWSGISSVPGVVLRGTFPGATGFF